jgi:hypothetical protein
MQPFALNQHFMKTLENNRYTSIDDYLYALQQRNLVYNYDFRYFSNQIKNGSSTNYGIPDGWCYEDKGANGSVSFDEITERFIIKKSVDNSLMTFKQALHEFPRWRQILLEKVISVKVALNLSIAGDISITLSDGIDSNTIVKKGIGDFELEVRLKINTLAKFVWITISSAVPLITLSIAKVYGNVGLVALENLPCIVQGVIGERKQYIATETPPAEELSLCQASLELSDDYSRLNSVINNRFGTGSKGNSLLIDMRGYFSRAWNNGAKVDPDAMDRKAPGTGTIIGDHVSTIEQDVFLKHDHGLSFSIDKTILTGDKSSTTIINTTSTSKTKETADGKETRPKNIAELYTIKWA